MEQAMWRFGSPPAGRPAVRPARRPSHRVRLQVEPLESREVPAYPSFLALTALGPLGATARGFEDGAAAGTSVGGTGDVNGDGFDDVLVGAPFTNAGGT